MPNLEAQLEKTAKTLAAGRPGNKVNRTGTSRMLRRAAREIRELRELVEIFGDIPFNCHDFMTPEQWSRICGIVAEKRNREAEATSRSD